MVPFRLELPPDQSLAFAPPLTDLPEGVSRQRHDERRNLRDLLVSHELLQRNDTAAEMGKLYQRAFRLIAARETADAFRLEREPQALRERYGMNVFGQSLLLARRLVEPAVAMLPAYWPTPKA